MVRWAWDFGRFGSLRLHHWLRSDDKRFKHDHPSDFATLVLRGSYQDIGYHPCTDNHGQSDSAPVAVQPYTDEHGFLHCPQCHQSCTPDGMSIVQQMTPGKYAYRRAEYRHTVSVNPGGCWTLLWFFPERRNWGFWVPRKLDGRMKFKKSNKFFLEHGHHPCDQP